MDYRLIAAIYVLSLCALLSEAKRISDKARAEVEA